MTATSNPRVSILLPAWNAAQTLPACLRSVQRQSEVRWHCVIVDDGSQDGTLACARDFAARDPRFEIVSMSHRGIVAALNAGLQRCRAPLIARMERRRFDARHRLAAQAERCGTIPDLLLLAATSACFLAAICGPDGGLTSAGSTA